MKERWSYSYGLSFSQVSPGSKMGGLDGEQEGVGQGTEVLGILSGPSWVPE